MAIKLKNKGRRLNAEINVTPFVDVVLVLLVIFMITAPFMYNGIKLDLPKTKKTSSLQLSSKQVILSINQSGFFFINGKSVRKRSLIKILKKKLQTSSNKTLYIRAHKQLRYGKLAKVMANLKSEGIGALALVTDQE